MYVYMYVYDIYMYVYVYVHPTSTLSLWHPFRNLSHVICPHPPIIDDKA